MRWAFMGGCAGLSIGAIAAALGMQLPVYSWALVCTVCAALVGGAIAAALAWIYENTQQRKEATLSVTTEDNSSTAPDQVSNSVSREERRVPIGCVMPSRFIVIRSIRQKQADELLEEV